MRKTTAGFRKRKRGTKEKKFKACFWNTTGTKGMEKRSCEEVKKMEIIGIIETWKVKDNKCEEQLGNFEWRSIKAEKEHKQVKGKTGKRVNGVERRRQKNCGMERKKFKENLPGNDTNRRRTMTFHCGLHEKG